MIASIAAAFTVGAAFGFTLCNLTLVRDTQRRLEEWRNRANGNRRATDQP